ncbi:hypothetical protein, partial [Leptospira kirschneri]|uniref:hypothetical protein n=1 Tax=Leptospira kirschneri TaxID=29507 RepID=UPI0009E495E5
LWELRQILCKTEPTLIFGWGQLNELLPMGRNSGGEVRKIFLYQKNILFASKKTHSCRNT